MPTKQTAKSCSCSQCRYAKHSQAGQYCTRAANRAVRHRIKVQLRKGADWVDDSVRCAPIG